MEVITNVTPIKENELYKIYIEKYFIDGANHQDVIFSAAPLSYKEYPRFSIGGESVFSLTKSEVQDLINKLTSLLEKP